VRVWQWVATIKQEEEVVEASVSLLYVGGGRRVTENTRTDASRNAAGQHKYTYKCHTHTCTNVSQHINSNTLSGARPAAAAGPHFRPLAHVLFLSVLGHSTCYVDYKLHKSEDAALFNCATCVHPRRHPLHLHQLLHHCLVRLSTYLPQPLVREEPRCTALYASVHVAAGQ